LASAVVGSTTDAHAWNFYRRGLVHEGGAAAAAATATAASAAAAAAAAAAASMGSRGGGSQAGSGKMNPNMDLYHSSPECSSLDSILLKKM